MSTQTSAALQAEINRLQLEVQSLKAEQGSELISVGNYLLARLAQLGVTVSMSSAHCYLSTEGQGLVYVWSPRGFQSWFPGEQTFFLHVSTHANLTGLGSR